MGRTIRNTDKKTKKKMKEYRKSRQKRVSQEENTREKNK